MRKKEKNNGVKTKKESRLSNAKEKAQLNPVTGGRRRKR